MSAELNDPIAETRATYDVIAAEYARKTGKVKSFDDAMAWMLNRVPAGGWVADIGCGPGYDLRELRIGGMRAVGLDLSESHLRIAGLPSIVQADMRSLPLRSSSMDDNLGVARHTLQVREHPWHVRLIGHSARSS